MEITKETLLARREQLHNERIQAARQVQVLSGAIQIVDEMLAALEKPNEDKKEAPNG